jgi:anti-sigma factor RsiW
MFGPVAVDGERVEKGLLLEPAGAVVGFGCAALLRVRVADFGEILAAAERLEQRQFRTHHHAAAGVESVEPDVGADDGVVLLHQCEVGLAWRQRVQATRFTRPVSIGIWR